MSKQIGSYNEQSSFFSGVTFFWSAINNQFVIGTIKNLNDRKNATSITRYDCSTLSTNIYFGKLIRIIKEHIDFCFKGSDVELVIVDRYRDQQINRQKIGAISFIKSSLQSTVKYLLNNYYFKLGNKIFR